MSGSERCREVGKMFGTFSVVTNSASSFLFMSDVSMALGACLLNVKRDYYMCCEMVNKVCRRMRKY